MKVVSYQHYVLKKRIEAVKHEGMFLRACGDQSINSYIDYLTDLEHFLKYVQSKQISQAQSQMFYDKISKKYRMCERVIRIKSRKRKLLKTL